MKASAILSPDRSDPMWAILRRSKAGRSAVLYIISRFSVDTVKMCINWLNKLTESVRRVKEIGWGQRRRRSWWRRKAKSYASGMAYN